MPSLDAPSARATAASGAGSGAAAANAALALLAHGSSSSSSSSSDKAASASHQAIHLDAALLARLKNSVPNLGPSIELAAFLKADFEAQGYANRILDATSEAAAGGAGGGAAGRRSAAGVEAKSASAAAAAATTTTTTTTTTAATPSRLTVSASASAGATATATATATAAAKATAATKPWTPAQPSQQPSEQCDAISSPPQQQQQQQQQQQRGQRESTAGKDVEGDVSVALSRLNLAIDDVGRVIKDEVTEHAPLLLSHTNAILSLSSSFSSSQSSLSSLRSSLSLLSSRISLPYSTLQTSRRRLARVRGAEMLLARAARFVTLAQRLEKQMQWLGMTEEEGEAKGRGLARAALCVRELTALLATPESDKPNSTQANSVRKNGASTPASASSSSDDDDEGAVSDASSSSSSSHSDESSSDSSNFSAHTGETLPLTQLDFVNAYLPLIDEWRLGVTDAMEDMVVRGLRDLSPALLATSLQTAFNLAQLPALVRDLLADLTDVIRERVRAALDVGTLAKETGVREPTTAPTPSSYASYRSRRNFTPAPAADVGAAQAWTAALWRRLETLLVAEMGAVCAKVYTLERVLRLKNDGATGVNFLDEALSVLGDLPSFLFWTTVSQSLESATREAAKSSPFVAEALGAGYPRLLRLFADFFNRVSNFTGTTYTQLEQR
ncbi:hypothetical protein FA09DRAFT_346405 [Tilletiopsis washingtonensis]|uniref:Conserved oligomeric Golgi complex subunit 5 n=1 Tax=Tilletiopsis washingtonensis TaxID=58919 RepID=A0A316Z5L2_9BASI|nr:hypothetical protein FA09DRAFT_346405 [Tilletiopsis washingtonensis]PWN97070.1 hypothetical protein FA09DRAFT_346405 [Tilletiopsis washingtonensis]